mgnify:CR=1 FL=1
MQWPAERRESISLLMGHFPFGAHAMLGSDDARYLTMFRDPVERVISHYYYVRRHPSHYLHSEVIGKSMSLQDYVQSNLTTELDNGQVRLVAGCENPNVRVSDDMVDDAIAHLKHWFISFGVLERFDESLILFRKDLGWADYPVYLTRNVANNKESVLQDERDAIREHNRFDESLYSWVCDAFAERLNGVEDFDRLLGTLRASTDAYARGYYKGRQEELAAVASRNLIRRVRHKVSSFFPSRGAR